MTRRLPRVLLIGLLAGCTLDAPPPTPLDTTPIAYDFLTKLALNVATVDIDDSWTPRPGPRHVEFLAPVPPLEALRRMARDRLVPGGRSGRAVFVIDDASIVQTPAGYDGTIAVHLDILTSNGVRSGFAEARATGTLALGDSGSDPTASRGALDGLVRQMMTDMNIEFEFQVRHALRDTLQPSDAAPTQAGGPDGSGAIERQTLPAPP